MFNTFLKFEVFAYQNKLGRRIVNERWTVNAVLACPSLECVLFIPDINL